jgi:hypothetical protein
MQGKRSSAWRWLAWLLPLVVLVVALATVISLAAVFNELPPDLRVSLDGERVDLHGLTVVHAWLVFGSVVLACVVALLVVPLALLFGLGVPLLVAALGVLAALLCAAVAVAVVGSPLILIGLLLWWAIRPRRPTAPVPPPPTAPPPVPRVGQHTDNATPLA